MLCPQHWPKNIHRGQHQEIIWRTSGVTIKCPKCGTKINAAKVMGAKGGKATSAAKTAAAKRNILKRWSNPKPKLKGGK